MIRAVQLIVGMEVHVELATRSKMFSRVASPAHPETYSRHGVPGHQDSRHGVPGHIEPNTLIDPVVLALPGALPVMNLAAVELSMMVGLALGCSVAPYSKWDRKSYFYADLPKNYQISQYDLPLCFDGRVSLPPIGTDGRIDFEALARGADAATGPRGPQSETGRGGRDIGIIRAHLEEDAGKLLHEMPGGSAGGRAGDGCSYADYNRAGTPLLEIVTQPDFRSAEECVVFAQMLRNICRFLGASEGVMQRGHMRFEPNINCILTLDDGRTIRTPIVEVKNLNSFKSLKGAIEFELREQPLRWQRDGIEFAPGTKTTRGWDDVTLATFVQREKEEAHDYRYFPDPDLPPVVVSEEWRDRVAARVPELPLSRARRFIADYALSPKEAAALTEERDDCLFYEAVIDAAADRGVERSRAGRIAANFMLQNGLKRANERSRAIALSAKQTGTAAEDSEADSRHGPMDHQALVSGLGIGPEQIGGIIALREAGKLSAAGADELFGILCGPEPSAEGFAYETPGRGGSEPAGAEPEEVATRRGLIIVIDDAALDAWCDAAIAAEPASVAAFKEGKAAALGRIVGTAMKLAAGKADAKTVRERLERKLAG
ncbi:MAG: Asp-tRNA(Asn)/Glu-tRNA(Gln) amidotransferase subunit GatB [Phycisphaeraceae bacterium]|nr:Asp-tRNA(Asn)/Glu-tRNA(Gln) amidotransferase subunit GatB [Phycisphaeraceae bacterium]